MNHVSYFRISFLVFIIGALSIVGATRWFKSGTIDNSTEITISGNAFYPNNRYELESAVTEMLDNNKTPKILIVPHAGYEYSGRIAAEAYNKISNKQKIKSVIIIGPAHFTNIKGICFTNADKWTNELGSINIDIELSKNISAKFPNTDILSQDIFANEHCIKVQLPFLQKAISSEFKIVPILISSESLANELAFAIYEEIKGRQDILTIISTDLTHYKTISYAKNKDNKLISLLKEQQIDELMNLSARNTIEACGIAALETAVKLAIIQGLSFELIRYGTSGESFAGNPLSIVSYLSAMFFERTLSKKDENFLMTVAEKAIGEAVRRNNINNDYKIYNQIMLSPKEVFVTLKNKNGDLKGCIGNYNSPLPLIKAVISNAKNAATQDPRFKNKPLTPKDLDNLQVSISILGPKIRIYNPLQDVVIGIHGLSIEKNDSKAVFLPEVAKEEKWSRQELLENLCLKAGLNNDDWKEGCKFYIFTTKKISLD